MHVSFPVTVLEWGPNFNFNRISVLQISFSKCWVLKEGHILSRFPVYAHKQLRRQEYATWRPVVLSPMTHEADVESMVCPRTSGLPQAHLPHASCTGSGAQWLGARLVCNFLGSVLLSKGGTKMTHGEVRCLSHFTQHLATGVLLSWAFRGQLVDGHGFGVGQASWSQSASVTLAFVHAEVCVQWG